MGNFTETMFLALVPDPSNSSGGGGTVQAKWWGGGWTDIARLEFRDAPSSSAPSSAVRFSAIATAEEPVLYGVSADADEVLAFAPDPDAQDLAVFVYAGRVYP